MGRHARSSRRPIALALVMMLLFSGNALVSVGVLAQQTTFTGTFTTIVGDPLPGSGGSSIIHYRLTERTGRTIELQVAPNVLEAAGGRLGLDRQHVTVVGAPGPSTQADAVPTLTVQRIVPTNTIVSLPKRQLLGGQPFLNILCKFSDSAVEPKAPAYFDALMGNGPSALGEYFSQASFGKINLTGSQTIGWFMLPHSSTYYLAHGESLADLDNMANDCTAFIPGTVNMNAITGINLIFNEGFAYAIGGFGEYLTINGVAKLWPMTWMPTWGYYQAPDYTTAGITTLAHEMGHAFGLFHSDDAYGGVYQNAWDVMSDTDHYCALLTDPIYGCLGQHMIAFDKDSEGWIPAAQKFTYAGVGQMLTFGALADASTPNYYLAVIPHSGTTTQFTTVEFRRLLGYDRKLPGTAVIIHEVDTKRYEPAWVQGTNGGAGAMFTAGMTYTAPNSNSTKVTVNAIGATTATVTIGVLVPHVLPPSQPPSVTGGVANPLPVARPAASPGGGNPNPLPPARP